MAKISKVQEITQIPIHEHPDDRRQRIESEREAKSRIGGFFRKHEARFVALVQTYSDAAAEQLLQELREEFWANLYDLPTH